MIAEEIYSSLIEEEKKTFEIENELLKVAGKSLATYHSMKSVGEKPRCHSSEIYNKPPNRCAYLYLFATINTGLAIRYFRQMTLQKEVKNTLCSKETIKVCSLGGGPGTDVFGVFRALARIPSLHGKITEVSVLDISSGWENIFSKFILSLQEGKAKRIPATLTNQENFTHKFITVNLLDSLPQNVKEVISNADILCMTRFVSELLGDERSSNALKIIGNLIKLEAVVLCIDVCNEKVFELSKDIFKGNGFETVLGPLQEKFMGGSRTSQIDVYGTNPQFAAKFFIVGWQKTSVTSIINTVLNEIYSITNDSDGESEVRNTALEMFDSMKEPLHSLCHRYTQTESAFLTHTPSSEIEDVLELIKSVSNLINIAEQLKQKFGHRKCCCCCHHHQYQSC